MNENIISYLVSVGTGTKRTRLFCKRGQNKHPTSGREIGGPYIKVIYGSCALSPQQLLNRIQNDGIEIITFHFGNANGSTRLLRQYHQELVELKPKIKIIADE